MIERLIRFLRDLPGDERPRASRDDPRLCAAALMVHVMDADGVRHDEEMTQLEAALGESWGISGAELRELVASAEDADREAVDLYSFTSVLKRHLDEEARIEFIRGLWEVVYADGEKSEVEDNIVWRIAELIGVERRDRIAMRQQAAGQGD